jgi:hypothetical protein
MTCVLAIAPEGDSVSVLGTRHSAIRLRERVTKQLETCATVQISFDGVEVTQAFIDELFGPLILRMGPLVLDRFMFSGCSDEAKAILQLVFASRLQDFSLRHQTQRPAAAPCRPEEALNARAPC